MSRAGRTWLAVLGLSLALPFAALHAEETQSSSKRWTPGIEQQRQADLGEGTFRNPVLAGDRPDPSVLKDGDDSVVSQRYSNKFS